MSKKIFTLLLLAVFVLAQFSMASAAALASGTVTITAAPAFSDGTTVDFDWSATDMPAVAAQYVVAWSRLAATPATAWVDCQDAGSANLLTAAVGTYSFDLSVVGYNDQETVEFYFTLDDQNCAGGAVPPATAKAAMASTFVDSWYLEGFIANPPSLSAAAFNALPVACNTFEMWGLVSDNWTNATPPFFYSGFSSWNPVTTGTFAPPAPEGTAVDMLSWVATIPATASGNWSYTVAPTDKAGNAWGLTPFRTALAVTAPEKADCKSFSDTAGNANELYVRYLADLGIGAGNADGTYGPDTTLTRAEAAALLEVANGRVVAGLPTTPSAACTFSDVAATDWFAGWVWQACADGFLNGVGGGKFDPSNTLTRGQIVTIFNNIYNMSGGAAGGYFDWASSTVLENEWDNWFNAGVYPYLREVAWTDVSVGAYYALPVQRAYGVGVAEATGATTFSPDQAILRGEFAKMLYRAISRN